MYYVAALVVPSALREKANLLACALGYDVLPGSRFSIRLTRDGAEFWCFTSEVTQDFIDLSDSLAYRNLPPIAWGDYGLTAEDVSETIQNLYYDKRPLAEAEGFYPEFLRVNGFTEV